MALKQLYPSKFVDFWPRLKELRRKYAIEMWTANEHGELLALGGAGAMHGVLGGFGNYHFSGGLGPNFSRIVDNPALHLRCLQATDSAGYSADMCATLKVTLGAMLIGEFDAGRHGEKMKSDFIWDVWQCQAQPKCTQLWHEQNRHLPVFTVEMPPTCDDRAYLIDQWQEVIEGISKATGKEYNDELLIEAVKGEWEVRRHWAMICELQQAVPAPLHMRWIQSVHALLNRGSISRKENIEFFRMALDEVKTRVKDGTAALAWERRRLMHEGIASYSYSPILDYPNRFGAIYVGGTPLMLTRGCWEVDADGQYHVGPALEELGLPLRTREDAFEALSRLYLEYNFGPRMIIRYHDKVIHLPRITQQWHGDGVVLTCSRGCRGQSVVVQQAAQALKERKIPSMIYENSAADPTAFDLGRYTADMDAFLESLGLRPIDDYVSVEPPDYHEF